MRRAALAYGAMVASAIALFLLIAKHGERLSAPVPVAVEAASVRAAGAQPDALVHLLIALTAVIVAGRVLAALFDRLGQPRVIGEVVAGLLLGPSLLGAVAPAAYDFILPASVLPLLGIVAQLGVVLYMFLVGLELKPGELRGQIHATVAISHASIVLPFVLGAWLALYLYPRYSSSDVSFMSFALFLGIAMSITAFPVLARILFDLGMTRTRLGVVVLACAAADDVTAWCLLALMVGVVQAAAGRALLVVALTLLFIGTMFAVVRPLVARLAWGARAAAPDAVAVTLIGLLASALTAEAIGVHAIFGAFLFGAVIPHDSRLAREMIASLAHLVTILLLPAFFAFAGVRTEVGLVSGWQGWLACGLIVLIATVGKVGGTALAGRATGLAWREAAALGVLMNTRGLMQLIVLNVGLDLGLISPTLFTMMVVMALATTLATAPILRRLVPLPASAASHAAH
jgi:Kef-type K+ transport system membrane component KefB